jgi:hypothetical protein
MNSLKLWAMNCGPLSEMILLASGYFSLARSESFRSLLPSSFPQIPIIDHYIRPTHWVVETCPTVDIGNIEANAGAAGGRSNPNPFRRVCPSIAQQTGLLQQPRHARGLTATTASASSQRQSSIPFTLQMQPMIASFSHLQPEIWESNR